MFSIKKKIALSYNNFRGLNIKKRLIIFESDDWGSIRIPSLDVLNELIKKGIPIQKTPYRNDSLESDSDIEGLGNVLTSFKDSKGNFPVITINNIVANPDFERIKETGFRDYIYEKFIDTYKQYPGRDKCMNLWAEGIEKRIFKPQFHGREHLNVKRWMTALQNQMPETHFLFNLKMFGVPASISSEKRRCYQRAFDLDFEDEKQDKCDILSDGLNLFEKIWGYRAETFVPPNYFWFDELEECAKRNNIRIFQGQRVQYLPDYKGGLKIRRHYIGQKNNNGQRYLIRNCFFEPSFNPEKDWVNVCISEIKNAFFFLKPAIIGTHRVNYIGSINYENRGKNLRSFELLLKNILRKWPDVEFISSEKLASEYLLYD